MATALRRARSGLRIFASIAVLHYNALTPRRRRYAPWCVPSLAAVRRGRSRRASCGSDHPEVLAAAETRLYWPPCSTALRATTTRPTAGISHWLQDASVLEARSATG